VSDITTALRVSAEAAARASALVVAAFAPSNVRLYPLAAPTNPTFPYVVFRVEVIGDDTECAEGAEAYLLADVYARSGTYLESVQKAEAIAGALRKVWTAPLTLDGHVIDEWEFEGDRPIGDPDVLTEHRNLRFRYLTTATA
jgi:hypothetical protein